jgi:hypothetical protein
MSVIWDTIDGMEANELFGVTNSATRRGIVNPTGEFTNSNIIQACFNDPDVPKFGDYFPGNTNLICVNRRVKLLTNCKTKAEVFVDYSSLPDSDVFMFSGGTALTGVSTQVDRYQNENIVAHQWPVDDPRFADYPSGIEYQGTDLNVLMPQTVLTATGQLTVDYPDLLSELWVGSMNATHWASTAPFKYLCTRCDFKGLDVGFGRNRKWLFTFEFQKNLNGWMPQIHFTDSRTGRPPRWLIPGIGWRSVDWYGALDYHYLFGVR